MQKRPYFLFFLLLSLTTAAQTSTPAVPEQLLFAGISVRFDADARRIVQQDVNTLVANRQYWTAKLNRVALYFPLIEAILIDEEVPSDFKYLAVQESSLTPDAVSSSAAVGYWQFKRETATANGLRVDDDIDERKSIIASTHGAASYLKKNNAQFNNWVSSLYSYYLGASGIAKLIPPDWSYARDIVLDSRTDRYILRFFAHKIAIESALKYHQASNRFALIEYAGGGGKTIAAIATELGVDEFELRKYNRWVLGETVPTDKDYIVAVPVLNDQINDVRQKIVNVGSRKTPDFVQNDVGFPVLRRVALGAGNKTDPILYEINGLPGIQAQAGDDASSLARKAKMSLSSFLRYNDLSDRDPILPNDVYYLVKKRRKALVPFHTVRSGETARSISQRYALRLRKLMRFNQLDRTQKLAVGRVMWLRQRRPASRPVEIINAPTAPVYDQTPSPAPDLASSQPTESSGNPASRAVAGSKNIPRDASERKLYQPKLVGGGITPSDGTSEPATVQPAEPRPVRQPAPLPTPVNRPATGLPTDADGSQRVVIVRSPETVPEPANRPAPAATRPLYPTTAAESTAARPSKKEPADPVASRPSESPARNPPTRTPAVPQPDRYDGPREQQANGSITIPSAKAPPRPPAPAADKTEPKPVSPNVRPEPAGVAAENRAATTHLVEPGQTYYSISKLYGLTVDELLAYNNRTTANVLEAGQQLVVVMPAGKSQPAKEPSVGMPATGPYHTVAKGETLFRISKLYGVTIAQLQAWNNLTEMGVREGQKIKIVK